MTLKIEDNLKLKNEDTEDYKLRVSNEYRTRESFSFLGFIVSGSKYTNDLKWTGKFFGYVTVEERKISERYTGFDSGYSYQSYWKPWKDRWVLTKIRYMSMTHEEYNEGFLDS